MTNTIEWPPPYTIRRYRLAKHVKLRASRADGLVISTPQRFSIKHIPNILEENRDWIVARLNEIQAIKPADLPLTVELAALGQTWKIEYAASDSRTRLYERTQLRELVITGNITDHTKCRDYLRNWVRKISAAFLTAELQKISTEIQLPFSSVSIRDQKTLWGSCTSASAISLNYKLIFLPYPLARHVMIHELSHTQQHNHSIRFWQLVAKYDENWRQHKRQLRQAEKNMPNWLSD